MNNIGKNSFDIGYLETLASGDSPLHRLDPRAKLIATLVFIVVVVSFDRYAFSVLLPFLAYPAALISVGGLPLGYLLKKLLVVSPFAVLVGLFNPLIDRDIFLYIGSVGISGGWVSFFSILLRFALTVSAALILVSTTGFNEACGSLMRLGVPRLFVVQLMFFYRYIFVLTDEAERMTRAGTLRSFHSRSLALKTFISLAGHLLLRTLDRAERIYCAMRCRGFDGRIRMIRPRSGGHREVAFVAGWSLFFLLARFCDIPLILEALLTGGFR